MTPTAALAEVIETLLPNIGYPVFINHQPKDPANAVLLFETGRGKLEDRNMRQMDRKERPLIQVVVRGVDSTAREVLQQISDMTQTVVRMDLSDGQKLHLITKSNTIGFAGQEPQTRRYLYTQQFRLVLE